MEILEEIYATYKIKYNAVRIKDFDNFEDAYTDLKKDKNDYDSGYILHEYKVREHFYEFDNKPRIPRDQMIDMINNT